MTWVLFGVAWFLRWGKPHFVFLCPISFNRSVQYESAYAMFDDFIDSSSINISNQNLITSQWWIWYRKGSWAWHRFHSLAECVDVHSLIYFALTIVWCIQVISKSYWISSSIRSFWICSLHTILHTKCERKFNLEFINEITLERVSFHTFQTNLFLVS